MKKLIFVLSFMVVQLIYALEVERIGYMDLGLSSSNEKFNHPKVSEVRIKGKPGKRVTIKFPYEVSEKTRRGSVELERVYSSREEITLDSRGRGSFQVGVLGKASGSGVLHGKIPFVVEYVN